MQAHEPTAISTVLHPLKVWERFVDNFIPFLNVRKIFSIVSTIFLKTLNLLWKKKVMENQRFLTVHKNEIMERSRYCYIGRLHILTNTYTTALTTKQVARKVLFPLCLIERIPLSPIKMTLPKKRQNKVNIKGKWISRKYQ